MSDHAPAERQDRIPELTERVFRGTEFVLYGLIGLLLAVGALVVIVEAGVSLVADAVDHTHEAIEKTLDSLLIAFILVELLSAVRETLRKRQLVAEPFLLVGVIASIKEIVVIGAFADKDATNPEDVVGTVLQLGVLGAVVLALSIALLLLRRKEREPEETGRPPHTSAPDRT
jgi:uncharacterized membrane protein (DUF373 family)